jgi:glutaredoxin
MSALVKLYTSPGCHLCQEARKALLRVQKDQDFELREQDITSEDALHRAYLERVPVVTLNGEVLFDYFVREDVLRARLAALH